MSGRGNCYDNAMVESVFKTIKSEFVWRTTFATRDEAAKTIGQYIEGSITHAAGTRASALSVRQHSRRHTEPESGNSELRSTKSGEVRSRLAEIPALHDEIRSVSSSLRQQSIQANGCRELNECPNLWYEHPSWRIDRADRGLPQYRGGDQALGKPVRCQALF